VVARAPFVCGFPAVSHRCALVALHLQVYFALNGLDLLGGLHMLKPEQRRAISEWLYATQLVGLARQSHSAVTLDVATDVSTGGAASNLSGLGADRAGGVSEPPGGELPGLGEAAVHPVTVPSASLSSAAPSSAAAPRCNVAMLYASLACLVILGDDLARVDRAAVARALATLQLPPPRPTEGGGACIGSTPRCLGGAVMAAGPGGEADVRYVYSAVAVCAILGLWGGRSTTSGVPHRGSTGSGIDSRVAAASGSATEDPASGGAMGTSKLAVAACPIDVDAAAAYCLRCQSFEGGFALYPGSEAHGGSTYCATAALALCGRQLALGSRAPDPAPCRASDAVEAHSEAASRLEGHSATARAPPQLQSSRFCWNGAPSASRPHSAAAASEPAARLYRWLCLRQRDPLLCDEHPELQNALLIAAGRPPLPLPVAGACCAGAGGAGAGGAGAGGAGAGGAGAGGAAAANSGAGQCSDAPPAAGVASARPQPAGDGEAEEEADPDLTVSERIQLAGPGGMRGRPGKPSDTCYTFWITAALTILAGADTADAAPSAAEEGSCVAGEGTAAAAGAVTPPSAAAVVSAPDLHAFVLGCQHLRTGGFGKDAESYPDPMHTYYALAGLALTGCPGLQPLEPTLSISARAAAHLRGLHERHGW